jgi:cytochrome c-type biogenesis protein CcmH
MPAGATLFVIVRTPGPAMGPPLGVRRLNSPTLPLEITISDSDAMIKERTISSQTEIQLQARLSLKGAPQAMSGDWQSTPLILPLSAGEPVQLILDQKVE